MSKSSLIGIIVGACVLLIFMFALFSGGDSGSRGDGKETCRNCGRDKPLSYMGYCSTCQEGFNEWQERYYND